MQRAHTLVGGLGNLAGRDQPTTHGMDTFAKKIMEQETDMEEYYPQEQGMKPNLPTLLT